MLPQHIPRGQGPSLQPTHAGTNVCAAAPQHHGHVQPLLHAHVRTGPVLGVPQA